MRGENRMKKGEIVANIGAGILIVAVIVATIIIANKLDIGLKHAFNLIAAVCVAIYGLAAWIFSMFSGKQKSKSESVDVHANTVENSERVKELMKSVSERYNKDFRTDFMEFVHEKGVTTADEAMMRVARNAIPFLEVKLPDSEISVGASKSGGYPDLPESIAYPTMEIDGQRYAMQLMAQINLSKVAPFDTENLLPKTGMLYIFWDGRWPEGDVSDVCKVIYYDGNILQLKRVKPVVPYYTESGLPEGPLETVMWFFEFSKNEYDIDELEEELGEIFEYYRSYYDLGGTKMLGYPVGSMNITGLFGDMVNLFQLDFHFGCLWSLYWYIDKTDLKNKNFDKVFFDWDMD